MQWSLQRRREYLNWTEGVVSGCRGCNEADLYDRTIAAGRQILHSWVTRPEGLGALQSLKVVLFVESTTSGLCNQIFSS
jgi:hypothetical protein